MAPMRCPVVAVVKTTGAQGKSRSVIFRFSSYVFIVLPSLPGTVSHLFTTTTSAQPSVTALQAMR
jgi:hypothetical protein